MPEVRYVGLAELVGRATAAVAEGVGLAAHDLVARAQAATPVDTGTLRASIHTDGAQATAGGATAIVKTGGEANDYAVFVHEGTAPHPIDPVNGRVLAFNGRFATHVDHPGTPPFKYLEGPLKAMGPAYRAFIAAAASKAF